MKKAFITSFTTLGRAYLAKSLLAKSNKVLDIKSRTSLFNTDRVCHVYQNLYDEKIRSLLCHGNFRDSTTLVHIIQQVRSEGNL